uniref:Ripply transcriptional repressor 1 n=1 Tax=Cyanoderma ruficeps TaxID=181631 RepID=A0A8C3NY86_9PASS
MAAPSPGGTHDAAGGDGPCEFGAPYCVCPHAREVGVPVGRKPASRPGGCHPTGRRGTAVPAKRWRSSSTRSGTCVAPGPREGAAGTAGGGSPRLSPRRLLWPKSKAFDHLYSVGEKLLENFPVQATLFFYEDSGSEEEEDEEDEEEEEEGDDEEEEATGDVTAGHLHYASSPGPSRPV